MDSLSLGLLVPTNCVSTRYLNNSQDLNSVIDLMFLRYRSGELDHNFIYPDWHLSSDHVPLTVTIPIIKEHVQNKKQLIIKDSEKEKSFINDLIKEIKAIDTNNLTNVKLLEKVINLLANTIEETWYKNLKIVNITIYSKSWWDLKCGRDLEKYRLMRSLEDWMLW